MQKCTYSKVNKNVWQNFKKKKTNFRHLLSYVKQMLGYEALQSFS